MPISPIWIFLSMLRRLLHLLYDTTPSETGRSLWPKINSPSGQKEPKRPDCVSSRWSSTKRQQGALSSNLVSENLRRKLKKDLSSKIGKWRERLTEQWRNIGRSIFWAYTTSIADQKYFLDFCVNFYSQWVTPTFHQEKVLQPRVLYGQIKSSRSLSQRSWW